MFDQTVSVVSLASVKITPDPGGVSATLAGDSVTMNIAHSAFSNGTKYTVDIPLGAVQNSDSVGNADVSWKKTLAEGAIGIFGSDQDQKKGNEGLIAQLYQQIGQLKVERDFLESRFAR